MIYLDNAATTTVYPDVLSAMSPFLSSAYGNPSSIHTLGIRSRKAVDEARSAVARALGASSNEIFFTSGGTESNNWAIKSVAFSRKNSGIGNHIITSAIEHPSVLRTCKYLERNGFDVTYLPVNAEGTVRVDDVKKALRHDTILVSIMMANNEIGTIEPIRDIASVVHGSSYAIVHTDAVQAVGAIPVDVKSLDVDMLSLSGHKFHAPKGIGALYIKNPCMVEPLMHGGGQENGFRSGTENVAGIVGIGKAIEIAARDIQSASQVVSEKRRCVEEFILKDIPGSHINGHFYYKLPGIISVSFDGIEGESLMMLLDKREICVSTGSACHASQLTPSHVLTAIGVESDLALGTIRISISSSTTDDELNAFTYALRDCVRILRDFNKSQLRDIRREVHE